MGYGIISTANKYTLYVYIATSMCVEYISDVVSIEM